MEIEKNSYTSTADYRVTTYTTKMMVSRLYTYVNVNLKIETLTAEEITYAVTVIGDRLDFDSRGGVCNMIPVSSTVTGLSVDQLEAMGALDWTLYDNEKADITDKEKALITLIGELLDRRMGDSDNYSDTQAYLSKLI